MCVVSQIPKLGFKVSKKAINNVFYNVIYVSTHNKLSIRENHNSIWIHDSMQAMGYGNNGALTKTFPDGLLNF